MHSKPLTEVWSKLAYKQVKHDRQPLACVNVRYTSIESVIEFSLCAVEHANMIE